MIFPRFDREVGPKPDDLNPRSVRLGVGLLNPDSFVIGALAGTTTGSAEAVVVGLIVASLTSTLP